MKNLEVITRFQSPNKQYGSIQSILNGILNMPSWICKPSVESINKNQVDLIEP